MPNQPISRSQRRACTLLNIAHDQTYHGAATTLSAAGLPADGLPDGHTWRSAAQLSDDALRALLVPAHPAMRPSCAQDTTPRISWAREAKDRALLSRRGYRWRRVTEEDADAFAGWPDRADTGRWTLIDPNGHEVTLTEALAAVGARRV